MRIMSLTRVRFSVDGISKDWNLANLAPVAMVNEPLSGDGSSSDSEEGRAIVEIKKGVPDRP
jgi:hypothetical protein